MEKIKTKNSKFILKISLLIIVFVVGFFVFENKFAESADCDFYLKNPESVDDDCSQLTDEQKLKECKKRSEDILRNCKMIDLKGKQQTTLQKQMELIDAEQTRNRSQITATEEKIAVLSQQISELEREINEKESSIKYYRAILSGMMQAYYARYQQGTLNIVLLNNDFSETVSQADYLDQTSGKMSETLLAMHTAKSYLDDKHNDLNQKNKDLEDSRAELESKKSSLQENETKKQSLLTQTQGEEAKYQQLLARVEAQKLELFNFSSAENIDEIKASVSNYAKPDKKYWASESWYFSQLDSRWGSKTIGNSNSLMKDWGCAIASVSMVFKFNGISIDPGTLAKQKIYYYDLINWPGSWQPNIQLVSSVSHGNISWSKIDSEIAKKHPVIVYIKKTNGRGGHYVVIHNKDSKDYVVHDPYFGSNLYLGTSKSLVGKIGTDSGTVVDQMIIYN